jgi:hypothetical protein
MCKDTKENRKAFAIAALRQVLSMMPDATESSVRNLSDRVDTPSLTARRLSFGSEKASVRNEANGPVLPHAQEVTSFFLEAVFPNVLLGCEPRV